MNDPLEQKNELGAADVELVADSSQPSLGAIIDGREVLAALGAGGMGSVYKVRHLELKRLEALKVMHPHFRERSDFVKRFQREARSVAALKHPNIVDVYAFGLWNDTPYLSLEYLEGRTLAQLLQETGDMTYDKAVPILLQICSALQAAHDAGVIHRDLKPENLMLFSDETGHKVKILDFGLAKMCFDDQHLTQTGEVVGDPRFMSPEQCQGLALDHRTDIYSLGCVMYEMLAGKPPYAVSGSHLDTMYKKLNERPQPFPTGTNIPGWLMTIVFKAMALRPEDRFQSAGAVAAAIKEETEFEKSEVDTGPAKKQPFEMKHAILALLALVFVSILLIRFVLQAKFDEISKDVPVPPVVESTLSNEDRARVQAQNLGLNYLHTGRVAQAIPYLKQGIATEDRDATWRSARGLVWAYEALGEYDKAQHILSSRFDLAHPNNTAGFHDIWTPNVEQTLLLMHQGKIAEAKAHFAKTKGEDYYPDIVILDARLPNGKDKSDHAYKVARNLLNGSSLPDKTYRRLGAQLVTAISTLLSREGDFVRAADLRDSAVKMGALPEQTEWAKVIDRIYLARMRKNQRDEYNAIASLFHLYATRDAVIPMMEVQQFASRYKELSAALHEEKQSAAVLQKLDDTMRQKGVRRNVESFLY